MKELIKGEGGDEKILMTAIYLHDIGYPGLLRENYTFEEVSDKTTKEIHMKKGAETAEKILKELGEYTPDEIREIVHLVYVHDKIWQLSTHNEILVMEADSLSSLDRNRTKITLDKENMLKFLEHFERKRTPRFKTKTGKKILSRLLKQTKEYVMNM
jgi:hypothetical protein